MTDKVFTYTDRGSFPLSHKISGHKTYYALSDNLLTLYECCVTCMLGLQINDDKYKPPSHLHLLICKSQRDYRTECCGCLTVTECREKHDCCCDSVLAHEKEAKRIEEKERKARVLIAKDPELAEMICKHKEPKND